MAANSSLPLAVVNYGRQTPSCASSNAPAPVFAIDHSHSLDHICAILWNSLPAGLRDPTISLGQFRRTLKTHLFLN